MFIFAQNHQKSGLRGLKMPFSDIKGSQKLYTMGVTEMPLLYEGVSKFPFFGIGISKMQFLHMRGLKDVTFIWRLTIIFCQGGQIHTLAFMIYSW